MRHNNSLVMAISTTPNPTRFQKTLGLNDYGVQIHGDGLPAFLQWFPEKPFDWIAEHSLDFWLTSEDLPLPQNRVY